MRVRLKNKKIDVLLIEDDEGHARLICDGLRGYDSIGEIHLVDNGKSALDFVEKTPPHLILLDLNIPKIHGFEVLRILKADERFRKIPIVVITSIDDQRDINKAYQFGANHYITKPIDFGEFESKLKSIGMFLDVASYPD